MGKWFNFLTKNTNRNFFLLRPYPLMKDQGSDNPQLLIYHKKNILPIALLTNNRILKVCYNNRTKTNHMDTNRKYVALVTGSTGGLGTDMCKRLAQDGFHVI